MTNHWPSDRVGKAIDVCVWREDEDGGWATGCGETFCFEYEGPRQHLHYFCANCGKPIDEVKYEGEEDK